MAFSGLFPFLCGLRCSLRPTDENLRPSMPRCLRLFKSPQFGCSLLDWLQPSQIEVNDEFIACVRYGDLQSFWSYAKVSATNSLRFDTPVRRLLLSSQPKIHLQVARLAANPASVQPVEVAAARLLAMPILQEYDAFTVDVLTWIAARHNLVEIAAAS